MRYIPIKTCNDCPHKDHRGGFGRVAYIPVCRLTDKNLPYTVGASGLTRMIIANYTGEIPDSCPLGELNEH